jgi:hypothetical protein
LTLVLHFYLPLFSAEECTRATQIKAEDWEKEYRFPKPHAGKPILLYCRSNRRAKYVVFLSFIFPFLFLFCLAQASLHFIAVIQTGKRVFPAISFSLLYFYKKRCKILGFKMVWRTPPQLLLFVSHILYLVFFITFFKLCFILFRYVYQVFKDAGWENEGIKMLVFKDGVAGLSRLSPNVSAYDSYEESDPFPPVIPPVDPLY